MPHDDSQIIKKYRLEAAYMREGLQQRHKKPRLLFNEMSLADPDAATLMDFPTMSDRLRGVSILLKPVEYIVEEPGMRGQIVYFSIFQHVSSDIMCQVHLS